MTTEIWGVWRLATAVARSPEGYVLEPPYGPSPMGLIAFEKTGRMISVVCDGRVDLPAGSTRAYTSYGGPYTVEGEILTTTVDVAADASRIGSRQVRRFELQGDVLILFPPSRVTGDQRELRWERVERR